MLGNAGARITSSMGNMVGGGNIARSISSGGGLSVPGLASRLNLGANNGSGSLSVQGQNRLMGGVLPQGICPWTAGYTCNYDGIYEVRRCYTELFVFIGRSI